MGPDGLVLMADMDINADGKITIEEWMKFFNEQSSRAGLQSVLDICSAVERNATMTGSYRERHAANRSRAALSTLRPYKQSPHKQAPYKRVMPRALEIRVERLFKAVDTNDDAVLSPEECIRSFGKDGYAMFDLDKDGDTKIDIEEWMRFFHRHCQQLGAKFTEQLVASAERRMAAPIH